MDLVVLLRLPEEGNRDLTFRHLVDPKFAEWRGQTIKGFVIRIRFELRIG